MNHIPFSQNWYSNIKCFKTSFLEVKLFLAQLNIRDLGKKWTFCYLRLCTSFISLFSFTWHHVQLFPLNALSRFLKLQFPRKLESGQEKKWYRRGYSDLDFFLPPLTTSHSTRAKMNERRHPGRDFFHMGIKNVLDDIKKQRESPRRFRYLEITWPHFFVNASCVHHHKPCKQRHIISDKSLYKKRFSFLTAWKCVQDLVTFIVTYVYAVGSNKVTASEIFSNPHKRFFDSETSFHINSVLGQFNLISLI